MRTFYISLWDEFGFEANFPGYYRAAINMEYRDGAAVNTSSIQWHITGASTTKHVVAKLHGEQYGPAMFEFTLSSPVQYLNSGDTLTFAAKGMPVSMDSGLGKAVMRQVSVTVGTFESFMKEHPNASSGEIWEAAFIAGHQTAYTLLTGEVE